MDYLDMNTEEFSDSARGKRVLLTGELIHVCARAVSDCITEFRSLRELRPGNLNDNEESKR